MLLRNEAVVTTLVLLFVGSVLLVNGLVFLGVVEPKASVPINFLVGLALAAAVLFLVLPTGAGPVETSDVALGASGFLLFSFTYLTVAFNGMTGTDGNALGWYCGFAALIALFLSAVQFWRFGDPRSGWLWLSWAALFLVFFLTLAARLDSLARPAGALAIAQALTTCVLPAALQFTQTWSTVPVSAIAAVQVTVVAGVGAAAVRACRSPQSRTGLPSPGESSALPDSRGTGPAHADSRM